jgi:hypothetical protein
MESKRFDVSSLSLLNSLIENKNTTTETTNHKKKEYTALAGCK